MSTRSLPRILSALVFVIQPVTAATRPVISWLMSLPILTTLTWSSAMPFFASSALSRITAVGWVATVLPIMSFGVRIGFLFSEK